jgi:hypothetical protein
MFLSQYTGFDPAFGTDPVNNGSGSDYREMAGSSAITINFLCALCASAPLR